MVKKLWIFLLCVFFIGSMSILAQVRGSIEGTVSDENGDPLPGVVVKAESSTLIQPRYYTTDENGNYRLIELTPGADYQIEFKMMGFQTVLRTGISVAVNRVTRVDVQLKEVAFEEQVIITGAAPVLDTTSSTSGVNVEREFSERLPGADNYQTQLQIQGGTTATGGGNPSVRGGMRFNNVYFFDGVDTTDPLTGTFGANLNADAIAETEIMTGGMPAEYGRVSGGVINTVTKSGGNEFTGGFRIKYYDPDWELDSDHYESRGGTSRFEPTVMLGGPVMKDKLWFFITLKRIEIERETVVQRSNWPDGNITETVWPQDDVWGYYYAKLTWAISPEHQVFFTWSSDPMTRDNGYNVGRGTVSANSLAEWQQGGNSYGLNWTWIVSQNLFVETKIGIGRQELNIEAYSSDPAISVNFPDYDPINAGGLGWNYETDRDRDSYEISAKYFISDVAGNHEWKTGIAYHNMESYGGYFYVPESFLIYLDDSYTGGIDDWNSPEHWTDRSTWTIRHDDIAGGGSAKYYAFYIQDKWRPDFIEGFTVNAGVRFESHEGYNNVNTRVFKHDFFDMIAPRLGFVWDIGNTGKHKLNLFMGRFYNIWSTMFADFEEVNQSWRETYRWNPDLYDGSDPNSGWEYEGATTPGLYNNEIDRDVKPEYTDEFTIGYERELADNLSAGISYTRKLNRDIPEDYSIFLDEDGNVLWGGPGTDGSHLYDEDTYVANSYYYATTIPGYKRDYWGVELYSTAKMNNFTLIASYTYSESKGTAYDGHETWGASSISYFTNSYDTPNLSENLYGYIPYSTKHNVKLSANYIFSWGTSIGIMANWASGQPYSKFVQGERINGPGGTSEGWTVISEEGMGAYNLPDSHYIDLSIQHDFQLGKWGKLTLIGDIFNLTDWQGVTAVSQRGDSTFGDATGWNNPMRWQVAVKYEF